MAGQAAAGFYKDASGLVRLRGAIDSGTNGLSAFELPASYIPDEKLTFFSTQIAISAAERIIINTDGTVVPTGGNTNGVSLNGISFRVTN
jgi:hypothetical protein